MRLKKKERLEKRQDGLALESMTTNESYCFFMTSMVVDKNDDKKFVEIANDIWNYVHNKYPDVYFEFANYRDNEYKSSWGDFILSLPCYDAGPLDLRCVIDVIRDIKSKRSKLKKKYFAYIYKVMQEGWIGTGYEKMNVQDFVSIFQNEFTDLYDKNIYVYIPKGKGKLPNWKNIGPSKIDNVKLNKDAIAFAKEFITSYWALKKSNSTSSD